MFYQKEEPAVNLCLVPPISNRKGSMVDVSPFWIVQCGFGRLGWGQILVSLFYRSMVAQECDLCRSMTPSQWGQ